MRVEDQVGRWSIVKQVKCRIQHPPPHAVTVRRLLQRAELKACENIGAKLGIRAIFLVFDFSGRTSFCENFSLLTASKQSSALHHHQSSAFLSLSVASIAAACDAWEQEQSLSP